MIRRHQGHGEGRPARRLRRGFPRRVTLRALAANIVTTIALSAGVTAIRFALEGRFKSAVTAVIIAGVLDGLDGTIARLLKSTSRFGAELDSLSDVIAFGVAPAIVIYSWGLADLGCIGWIVALAYAVACALRLARYNTQAEEGGEDDKRRAGFFVGVSRRCRPSPRARSASRARTCCCCCSGSRSSRRRSSPMAGRCWRC